MSPVPGTAESIVEVLSATTKTDTPEHMAAVMATLPVMVQVVVLKAVTEDATPRTVRGAAAHCRVHVLRLLWRRGTPPPDTGQADGRIADLLQQLSEMPAFKRTPWPRGLVKNAELLSPLRSQLMFSTRLRYKESCLCSRLKVAALGQENSESRRAGAPATRS